MRSEKTQNHEALIPTVFELILDRDLYLELCVNTTTQFLDTNLIDFGVRKVHFGEKGDQQQQTKIWR